MLPTRQKAAVSPPCPAGVHRSSYRLRKANRIKVYLRHLDSAQNRSFYCVFYCELECVHRRLIKHRISLNKSLLNPPFQGDPAVLQLPPCLAGGGAGPSCAAPWHPGFGAVRVGRHSKISSKTITAFNPALLK